MDCPTNAFGGCACRDRCKNVPVINLNQPDPDPFGFAARAWLVIAILAVFGIGIIGGAKALERQAAAYQESLQ